MESQYIDSALQHRLDATVQVSLKWLCLGGSGLVSVYWFVDTYVVAPDKRVFYTVLRAAVSLIFLSQFFFIRSTKPSRWTFLHGYAFYAVYVTLFFCAVIGAGKYPSPYYGAPMLMISSMTIIPWRPLHTIAITTAISSAWLALNFHVALTPAIAVHLKYLVGLSGGVIYTSFLHYRLTIDSQRQAQSLQRALDSTDRVAMQTSHDIRSPIAALKYVSDGSDPHDGASWQMVKIAAQRIEDIANNLAREHSNLRPQPAGAAVLLSPLIDSIVSEKRSVMQQAGVTFSQRNTFAGASAFVRVDRAMFQRALSNLLNNAAESMVGGGLVTIKMTSKNDKVSVSIEDEGCGIDADKIPAVLEGGRSFGKRGTGLGLSGAAQTMRDADGQLSITSTVGKGTTIELMFPQQAPPSWFCTSLRLRPGMRLLCLDDDSAMGTLWLRRIKPFAGTLEALTFTSPNAFRRAIAETSSDDCMYLVDIELPGSSTDGIAIVKHHQIAERTVFVTSHYDASSLLEFGKAGAKVLPKNLAGAVPILLAQERTQVG